MRVPGQGDCASTARGALAAALLALFALPLAGCNDKPPAFQGWVEANLIFVGADENGRVETLSVKEGDHIDKGAPLFTLDDDLFKADLNMNMATLANAQQTFDRAQQLLRTGAGTQKDFDTAQAALRQAKAQVNSSQTRLARRAIASPVTGTVEQVYFRPGEVVTASKPIVALLPPGNIKIRFFVAETALARLSYGQEVRVHCDGCARDIVAKVSFIAKSAEFTPPVIYSEAERAKLVYLIEALPVDPGNLRVGQPVDVTFADEKGAEAKR
ncbi:MAG TPA: efflux RND transporter periplasmic adaptor subunit [Xanthobacteraceae bacterium]|nr:efflux RND transporter periplasmic adaptor subunit [Xanthobacteraceae bacterium]